MHAFALILDSSIAWRKILRLQHTTGYGSKFSMLTYDALYRFISDHNIVDVLAIASAIKYKSL